MHLKELSNKCGDKMDNKIVPVLYVSGPFSATDNIHGVEMNIITASKFALEAWQKGWAVICPHKNTQGYQHTSIPWSVWMAGDLAFIDRMSRNKGDAMLMLPEWQRSQGAMLEHAYAQDRGLKIYYAETDGVPEVPL